MCKLSSHRMKGTEGRVRAGPTGLVSRAMPRVSCLVLYSCMHRGTCSHASSHAPCELLGVVLVHAQGHLQPCKQPHVYGEPPG